MTLSTLTKHEAKTRSDLLEVQRYDGRYTGLARAAERQGQSRVDERSAVADLAVNISTVIRVFTIHCNTIKCSRYSSCRLV